MSDSEKNKKRRPNDTEEPIKPRDSPKVTPIRFDSAPTRVRFDSAPTKLRLESPEKAHADKPCIPTSALVKERTEHSTNNNDKKNASVSVPSKNIVSTSSKNKVEDKKLVSDDSSKSQTEIKSPPKPKSINVVDKAENKVAIQEKLSKSKEADNLKPEEVKTDNNNKPSNKNLSESSQEEEMQSKRTSSDPPLPIGESESKLDLNRIEVKKSAELTPAESSKNPNVSRDSVNLDKSLSSSRDLTSDIEPMEVEESTKNSLDQTEKMEVSSEIVTDNQNLEEKPALSGEKEVEKSETNSLKDIEETAIDKIKEPSSDNKDSSVESKTTEDAKDEEDNLKESSVKKDEETKMETESEDIVNITDKESSSEECSGKNQKETKDDDEVDSNEIENEEEEKSQQQKSKQNEEKDLDSSKLEKPSKNETTAVVTGKDSVVSKPKTDTENSNAMDTSQEMVSPVAVGGEEEEKSTKEAAKDSEKNERSEKAKGIDAIVDKLVKEKSEPDEVKEKGSPENRKDSTDTEAEIKTYATDTMNELLGLFGYDKMDDSVRDKLQLYSSISGNSEDDKKDDDGASPSTDENKDSQPTKSGSGRLCTECNLMKSCKYQVLMHGSTLFLCNDICFRSFRSKQKLTTPITSTPENRPQTRSVTTPKDYCNVCHKEIRNGQGFLPGVGENKPLCSEDCMRKYQLTHTPKRACAQCGSAIQGRNKCLTWETMEFCNEECLGKYQSYLGSHCACCNNSVQRTSLGKYCVRFGSDIKQFCSNNCLEEFKKGLKVCSFCQKDISSGIEGFLAPVGDKGQFKDFCSQQCMEKYETMNNIVTQPTIHQCSVCNKTAAIRVEVTFEGKSHKLCSEPCIAAFRYANKINTSICDTCHKFFDVDISQQNSIQFEGSGKHFCSKTCMNVFVLSHRKIVPCTWCKVKKYNFDMIERVDSNNHVQLFCSLNCLSLFRVSLNATSSRSVRCDYCQQLRPAQYHLTMSDASIRNFCSYQCVMNFQSQFTNVTPVTPSPPLQQSSAASTNTSQVATSTPVISSVISLAQPQQQKPSTRQSSVRSATTVSTSTETTSPSLSSSVTLPSDSVAPISEVTQQVVIKPPPPKLLKNKSLLCKPIMQTKGVSCKPHPCHKSTQTDDYMGKPTIVPIPVPVYVPTPMHMFVNPVPFPLPFALPIPVPIFIPTTKNSADGIIKQIKDIQEKIPANPFEAELLMMAEMVANDSGDKDDKEEASSDSGEQQPVNDVEQGEQFGMDSQLQDPLHATNAFGEDMLQMALRMATEMDEPAMDLEAALVPSGAAQQESEFSGMDDNHDMLSPRELRARARSQKRSGSSSRRGRKRAKMEENTVHSPQSSPYPASVSTPDSNMVLKYTYGVNAWKHWVLQKNTQLEKASQSNRHLKLFKTDLLQLTADELNYSLCLFVKEVRKPNGEEYAPDSIYYLCLGIQQYLFENARIDNIFTDAYFEKFTECLNEVLQKSDNIDSVEGCLLSRIEEEILWESKQLGAHSPHVLLNTLMYFNTKYFMLKTIEDHVRLSFSHVMKHWKKSPGSRGASSGRNVLLRYYPPPNQRAESGRKRKDDQQVYEQVENLDNPLRCPVKLYEFYLSKCPESIKNRSDVFYLYPERSCVPDSPVWYSTMPLGREAVAKMIQRIKMVREVCEAQLDAL